MPVRIDGSYLAASDPHVHFGLGMENTAHDVRVRWPDGTVEAFGDFEGGRTFGLRKAANASFQTQRDAGEGT